MMDGTQIPDGQFKMYPLVNSNSQGTLLYREETPVSSYNTVLYTSNPAGSNDSFKLVYTIIPFETQIPGSYHGRISYILQPIDSTESQVVVTLNIYVDMAAGTTPVIEVTASSVSGRISLTSEGMTPKDPFGPKENPRVSIKVHSPMGATYRIYQGLQSNAVVSGSGDEFDLSKISFTVDGGNNGVAARQGDLKGAQVRQLLYTSDGFGAPDEFVVTYKPSKDFRLQKADLYRGRLVFTVEKATDAAPLSIKTLDMEVDIEPVFDIHVYSGGKEGVFLRFGEISYKTGPKSSDVEVFVESNMGRPYQVVQKVSGPMMNEAADKIPEEDFVVRVKDVDHQQEAGFSLKDEARVTEGDTVIFASGPKGHSASFTAEYKLTLRPDSKPGNYSTQIGYSLALN